MHTHWCSPEIYLEKYILKKKESVLHEFKLKWFITVYRLTAAQKYAVFWLFSQTAWGWEHVGQQCCLQNCQAHKFIFTPCEETYCINCSTQSVSFPKEQNDFSTGQTDTPMHSLYLPQLTPEKFCSKALLLHEMKELYVKPSWQLS